MENNLNAFRVLRIARDKSIKELSEELMVTRAYVSAIEKGNRFPSNRIIRDYSKALNIDEEMITKFDEIYKADTFEETLLNVLKAMVEN